MRHNIEYKHFSPSPRFRETVEKLIRRLERYAERFSADPLFLRLVVEENAVRSLYHVSLTLSVPGRTLAAKDERHDAQEAVREAFAEIERELERHKELGSHEADYKRPARREAARLARADALPSEERDRSRFASLVERHLKRLHDFVRREIAYYEAIGDVVPGELRAEEVVDAVLPRAYRELARRPDEMDSYRWLLHLTMEHLLQEVGRRKSERRKTAVHIEEDVPDLPPDDAVGDEMFEFFQPDEDLKLEDLIADPSVPTPEDVVERRELRRALGRTLAAMPPRWRRAFVLHHVEGLPVSDIARLTRQSEAGIARDLENARRHLVQRLSEAGFVSGPPAHAAITPVRQAGEDE